MLELVTGKPGASKSLNTIAYLVGSNNGARPIFYNNIKLLMLDFEVASSFSGWFYGLYMYRLKNKQALKRIRKIIKRVHDNGDLIQLSDVPWLEPYYNTANHLDTWLFWVKKLYSPKQTALLDEFLSNMPYDKIEFSHLEHLNLHFTYFSNPKDWFNLPKQSVILIDECQQFFPPRPVGSAVPPHISKFETHRHDGYDIHLITQDRMLLDSNVRRLVNHHVHYHNAFNSNRVARYQNSKSFDVDDYHDVKNCQKSLIKRPTNFYGSYFSAELHTHKFKMPKAFYLFIFLVLVVCFSIYSFANTLFFDKTSAVSDSVLTPSESIDKPVTQSRISIKPTSTTLLDDSEKKLLTDFVSNSIKDVYISGSQYVRKSNGLVHYDYSFMNPITDEVFFPSSVGFVVSPITECLARLTFNDFTTFVTCQPLIKLKPDISQNNSDYSLANR